MQASPPLSSCLVLGRWLMVKIVKDTPVDLGDPIFAMLTITIPISRFFGFALSLKCQFWLKFTFIFNHLIHFSFNRNFQLFLDRLFLTWSLRFYLWCVSSGFRITFSSFGYRFSSFFSGLLASIGAAWLVDSILVLCWLDLLFPPPDFLFCLFHQCGW